MSPNDGLDLVRELATQLDRDDPAMALGLLIERERFAARPDRYHGPDPDELIRGLYGDRVAQTRLSPLAVHEAVDALLARVRTGAPSTAVVFALAKSFEPRVVPHLHALLLRIVGEPEHDAVGAQIVQAMVCFLDALAIDGIRVAAERGGPETRQAAAAWLAVHGAKPLLADAVAAPHHRPAALIAVPGEAYRLQRRPGHRDVITTRGPDQLRVLDPDRPEAATTIPCGGIIRAWCLRADGGEALVLLDRPDAAALVTLPAGPARPVALPRIGATDGTEHLRYVWDDRLLVSWGLVESFRELRRDPLRFEDVPSLAVRRDARAWRAVADQLTPLHARVLRTEPHEARVLAYDFTRPPGELVAASWRDGAQARVPAPGYIPDVARSGDCWFLLYDHEVQAIDATGAVVGVYPAPPGLFLRALDTLDDPPRLVVAAAFLDGGDAAQLLVYAL